MAGATTRDTSLQAYEDLLDKLNDRQYDVLEELYDVAPATARELGDEKFPGKTVNYYRPRLTELKNLGMVAEKGKRECEVSGKKAITWMLTKKGVRAVEDDG